MKSSGALAILQKEFMHMARDPSTILFALLPPIFQVIAFGFAIDTDVRNLSTIVCNQDGRQASRALIDQFENTGTFQIKEYAHSSEALFRALVEGRYMVGLHIPPDFSDRHQRGETATAAVIVDGSNNTIAMQAMSTAQALGLVSLNPQTTARQLSPVTGGSLEVLTQILFNPDLASPHFFVPGIIGVALQLSLTMLVAFAIVREREIGTLEQLMVSPATRFGLLVGKVIPYVVLAFVEMLVLVLVMTLIFQIPVHGSLLLLFALSCIFALAIIGIGLLISATAKTQVQATQMAIGTLLPSIFLSGFIYPRETMPDIFYWISFILPLTYFLEVLRGIILRGAQFQHLIHVVIPLSGMAMVLFTLSVLKFQKRLD